MNKYRAFAATMAALSSRTALRGLVAALLMAPLTALGQSTADVALTKEASIETVVPGTQFEYTFIITNNGPHEVDTVRLNDNLPEDLIFVSCEADPPGNCGFKGPDNFSASYDVISADTSVEVTLIVELAESTPPGTEIINTANIQLTPSVFDPDLSNNSDRETVVAVSAAEPLTFYLHGFDVPGTADGFTMDANPPSPSQPLVLNLINAPRWYSESALEGTFAAGDFELSFPCALGIGVATTYALHRTDLDGSNPELMASLTQPLQICTGMQTITIPVNSAEEFDDGRLRLRISTLLGLTVTLDMGEDVKLETPEFAGDSGPDPI